MFLLLLVVLAAFAMIVGPAYQWFTTPRFVGKRAAVEAVRKFEGKPELEIRCNGPHKWDPMPPRYSYVCSARGGGWYVDAVTGEVDKAWHPDKQVRPASEKPVGPLTKEQCQAIALRFVRSRFKDFDRMNFTSQSDWYKRWWGFTWNERSNGQGLSSMVAVGVSPVDGSNVVYQSRRRTASSPTTK